jgi:hypothetical protein
MDQAYDLIKRDPKSSFDEHHLVAVCFPPGDDPEPFGVRRSCNLSIARPSLAKDIIGSNDIPLQGTSSASIARSRD